MQVPLGLELLIRGIFCASCRIGLNLAEVELTEQNLSVITGLSGVWNFRGDR